MRRVTRHIINTVTALSLLLCVATVVLWVRSCWVREVFQWSGYHPDSYVCLAYHRGDLLWSHATYDHAYSDESEFKHAADVGSHPFTGGLGWYTKGDIPVVWEKHWAAGAHDCWYGLWAGKVGGSQWIQVIGPFWFLTLLTGVLPTWVVLRALIVGRRRQHAGLCSVCGYDLRASLDRCPECGTATPAKATV